MSITTSTGTTITIEDSMTRLREKVDATDHHSEPRRALYGRPGSMEMRCVVCNRPAPCSTWQIAQTQLEKLAA